MRGDTPSPFTFFIPVTVSRSGNSFNNIFQKISLSPIYLALAKKSNYYILSYKCLCKPSMCIFLSVSETKNQIVIIFIINILHAYRNIYVFVQCTYLYQSNMEYKLFITLQNLKFIIKELSSSDFLCFHFVEYPMNQTILHVYLAYQFISPILQHLNK